MALSDKDRAAIIKNNEIWLDSQFSPLDLRGHPSLVPIPEDTHDDRFAKQYGDVPLGRSAHDLQQFISNPDVEALSESGNPDLLAEVRDLRGLDVVRQFTARNDDYIASPGNYTSMVTVLAANLLNAEDMDADEAMDELERRGLWTIENLEGAWIALKHAGLAELPAGSISGLKEAEKLEVMRLSQNGRADAAIEKYLEYALDDTPTTDILTDPEYRPACDAAVWFVFQSATPDFAHTPERAAYIKRYCGSRPLTLNLLAHAWAACQRNEATVARDRMLGVMEEPETAPPTQKGLDELDDRSLDNLYHSTLSEYARSARRSTGMLA